ncbi:MAG: SagB/ThcOx family dehydrogenase [Cyanothece sp. SIO2G6]|nr:SagB/ThcOx family dehydrogenase [Cyanothece sp. SIO2G6]
MLRPSTVETLKTGEQSGTVTNQYHLATKHSVISVQIDPNYVDARTQPTVFKTYPHFFRRFPLDPNQSLHQFISLTSAITDAKKYRDGCTHLLRVQPSAGALYPTELYVQIRGIKGMIEGIYHLEPQTNTLTLIYELIDDGIEGYLPDKRPIKGCILLVSCVYFRSSWKYKNRSLRYCFLDSGHHLGAIEAAAYVSHHAYRLLFEFDALALNQDLGFGTQEFITGMVITGEPKERPKKKPIRRLRLPLPFVPGTDYFEPNTFIEAGYKESLIRYGLGTFPSDQNSPLNDLLPPPQYSSFLIEPTQWLQAIQVRRSARRFYPNLVSYRDFLTVCNALQQPIPSKHTDILDIYAVVHRVKGMQPGIYRLPLAERSNYLNDNNLNDNNLKMGEFQTQTGHLCLEQAIARDGAVVFFVASSYVNYGVALQQAGLVGQRIYLAATALKLGCSGIGAYYDDETQAFLNTDSPILYAIAIGQVTKSDNPISLKSSLKLIDHSLPEE